LYGGIKPPLLTVSSRRCFLPPSSTTPHIPTPTGLVASQATHRVLVVVEPAASPCCATGGRRGVGCEQGVARACRCGWAHATASAAHLPGVARQVAVVCFDLAFVLGLQGEIVGVVVDKDDVNGGCSEGASRGDGVGVEGEAAAWRTGAAISGGRVSDGCGHWRKDEEGQR
jgi:hypothetical protein